MIRIDYWAKLKKSINIKHRIKIKSHKKREIK